MKDIFIFGGGAWGMALTSCLSLNNNVFVLSRRSLDMNQYGTNQIYNTKAVQLNYENFIDVYNKSIQPLCLIAIASAFLREFLRKNQGLQKIKNDVKILAASKGIERESGAFVSNILEEYFSKDNLCYLAGPSFANEVKDGLPCALVIHSTNASLAKDYADCFPDFMKIYIRNDVIGAEIAGAYKNVIAIASGICDGLQLGNNAKASLISRGLVEMTRFGLFFNAKEETFIGLSGSGDLFLTSSSTMSRNYRVGFGLAKGKKLKDILDELGEVAEGVYSAKSITQISHRNNIHTPIANEVQMILDGGDVQMSLRKLLQSQGCENDQL
ncbi:NAD(P)H-dependent glycerol-3-phosphate dehydrogenase [Helicobacter muridarum]|uniref:Glycerol-3-phosphate dehydrogenase [NAD(P)+] n=1 Tax=Helicobacter muridarum TaxID=216 RepID=A0A099TZ86_9HELI|nr:NAD(P)H-dependent glycerol-3-phosphate dehydrogenase [Helicobacter muridarum]TLE00234.1 NAD(P)H-dependent glycerol-3-phosphate dehydrogenase [Helicobacter muridarum]STQ85723.1 glycerol 3-phosphate dehydrogenase [Helicobacter muridarum]